MCSAVDVLDVCVLLLTKPAVHGLTLKDPACRHRHLQEAADGVVQHLRRAKQGAEREQGRGVNKYWKAGGKCGRGDVQVREEEESSMRQELTFPASAERQVR